MKHFATLAVLSFLFLVSPKLIGQQLYINEFMASNSHTLADGTGNYEDWFEIYNPNGFSVDIAGYYLTDNLNTPTKYKLPTGSSQTIIPANGFLLLWASGEPSRGATHVSFKLSADGEQLGLYKADGVTRVDTVTFGAQRTDISRGRQPDGSSSWLFFQQATNNTSPGASNNGKTGYAQILSVPVFSKTGGFYTSSFNLTLSTSDPSVTIYYTLDGSDPDPANPNSVTFAYKNSYPEQPGQPYGPLLTGAYQSFSYTAPIIITDRSSDPNRVSLKSSTWNYTPTYFPTSPIFKGTVVRAVAYKANAIASDIVTQTYFITPNTARYNVPVISLALTEKQLFDYTTGIYTAGVTFDNFRAANPSVAISTCATGNFFNEGDAWEKRGNVEFIINNTSVINQPTGIRLHGGCSRAVARKSLRLYGDADFSYPFFPHRPSTLFYDHLLLRNGGNDWDYTTVVDAFGQTMVRHLGFDTQDNRPATLFVNGEYWGLTNLYERYDADYINRNYGIDVDSVDMIEVSQYTYEPTAGDLTNFTTFKNYFLQTSPVSYTYVNTLMDISTFTDYQISEIFVANNDWPNNNVSCWRKRTSQYVPNAARGQDGRWRWMIRDLDFGLSGQNFAPKNTLPGALDTGVNAEFTIYLRRLLEISSYKTYFLNRFADLLNTTFLPSRTQALLSSMQQQYQPNIGEHFRRWVSSTDSVAWVANMGNISTFLQDRPGYMRTFIQAQFGLTGTQSLTVNVSDTTQGYVKVNSITILPTTVGVSNQPYPWSGIYFKGNPVTVVAKAQFGYKFLYWKEGNTIVSTDTAYTYTPSTNRSLVAFFDLDNSFVGSPTAYSLASCTYNFTTWPASSAAGTYPANMLFVGMDQTDPTLSATISSTVTGAYNYTSRTRISGLGTNGISFINTGNTNTGFASGAMGGALLALRTLGVPEASVQWTGGTVTPNERQYAIRLRYRVGNSGPFSDLLDASNQPVEYVRNTTAGHSQVIGPVALPSALLNKPYVQLLWQYYWTGVGTANARDELRLDDIIISRGTCASLSSANWNAASTWSCGRVPTSCDTVLINDGHTVTITIPNAVAQQVQFGANAQLVYGTPTASLAFSNTP